MALDFVIKDNEEVAKEQQLVDFLIRRRRNHTRMQDPSFIVEKAYSEKEQASEKESNVQGSSGG